MTGSTISIPVGGGIGGLTASSFASRRRFSSASSLSTKSTTPASSNNVVMVASSSDNAIASAPSADVTGISVTSEKNMVLSLVAYLKDSVVRTVSGCGQLWTNHGRCNEIRKKQTLFRESLRQQWDTQGRYEQETPKQISKRLQSQQGGISYEEYIFLQQGKEDRGKVMNLGFLIWGAPRFLPYAMMFNPDMLPSPFQQQKKLTSNIPGESPADNLSRERTQAVLSTLMIMEKQAVAVSGGYLDNINIFGKKKQADRKVTLQSVVAETGEFFRLPSRAQNPSTITTRATNEQPTTQLLLERLAPHLYRTESDFSRSERRLCQVPPCMVQGLERAVTGQGLPGVIAQLTPAFMQRSKLVGHIQKVAASDNFLVQSGIDLDTIPKRLLQEACQDRLIAVGSHRSIQDMRSSLADWLDSVTSVPPLFKISPPPLASGLAAAGKGNNDALDSADSSHTAPSSPAMYYNDNLARMALMGYNACDSVRGSQCKNRLFFLLVNSANDSSTTNTGNAHKRTPKLKTNQ